MCENDQVEVTLINLIEDGPITNSDGSPNTTTIHFHGIREVGRTDQTKFGPWSDGVPYVNQCPVEKGETFVYFFNATRENMNAPPGTYWYHSHVGAQRTNGLEGVLVIRDKDYTEEQKERDLVIALQEWYDSPTCQVPVSILVNGKGRIPDKKFNCKNTNEVNRYLRGLGGNFDQEDYFPTKRGNFPTNYESFKILSSGIYRLRLAGLIGQNFPIRFSAVLCEDEKCSRNRSLTHTAVAADSLDIEPVTNINYTWLAAAERFDVQLDVSSLEACNSCHIRLLFVGFTNLFNTLAEYNNSNIALCTVAYLWTHDEPSKEYVHKCTDQFSNSTNIYPDGVRTLNPPSKNHSMFASRVRDPYAEDTKPGYIFPVDIQSKHIFNTSQVLQTTPITFYNVSTFNNIRTTWPDIPYLLQDPSLSQTHQRCNETNKEEYQRSFTSHVIKDHPLTTNISICQHVLKYEYKPGWWVETILINRDGGANHPIHQHGGWYWVVGEGQFFTNNSLLNATWVIEGLKDGSLKKNNSNTSWYGDSVTTLPKDVIQVPNFGYVVIRTPLDNPGNWIFHCHIDFHLSIGMGLG